MNLPDTEQRRRLSVLMESVALVPEALEAPLPDNVELPDKDRPIFAGIRPECCGNWAFGVTSLLNSWTTLRPHATCCHS